MEIRHLQTFISIVDLGGFTKAAENLGYAQSTITSHIKILESELNKPLFDRLGKKIILTKVGTDLIPYAKEILSLYEEVKNITCHENDVSGDLFIGAGESLCIYRLGKILKEYKESFPKVNIIIKNDTCSNLRSQLHSGDIDIVFTIEPEVADKALIVNKLKDESMVIIEASDSNLNSISSQSVLLTENGCNFRKTFDRYLHANDLNRRNTLEFSSIEVIKNCAINGLGFSFLPFYIVEKEVNKGILKAIPVEESYNNFQSQMIYHKNKNISIPMKKLIEITLKHVSKW